MAFKSCQIAFLFFERVRLPHSQSLKVMLEPTFIQSFGVFPHPSTIFSFIFKLGPSGHEMFYQLTILGRFPKSSSAFHRVVIRSSPSYSDPHSEWVFCAQSSWPFWGIRIPPELPRVLPSSVCWTAPHVFSFRLPLFHPHTLSSGYSLEQKVFYGLLYLLNAFVFLVLLKKIDEWNV